MKIGDVVVRTSEELDGSPMIYMGKGLWTGWIHTFIAQNTKIIQVRNTYVQKVMI